MWKTRFYMKIAEFVFDGGLYLYCSGYEKECYLVCTATRHHHVMSAVHGYNTPPEDARIAQLCDISTAV